MIRACCLSQGTREDTHQHRVSEQTQGPPRALLQPPSVSPNTMLGTVTTPAPSAHRALAAVASPPKLAAEGTGVVAAEPVFGDQGSGQSAGS